MQINTSTLEKKAIDAALKQNWKEAILVNLEILEKSPSNKDAKIRLGRAHLHEKDYNRAKKLFKEVLEVDPINPIALKNYKLATEKAKIKDSFTVDPKSFLKEPGKTKQLELDLENGHLNENSITAGDALQLKINKTSTTLFTPKGFNLTTIKDEIARVIYTAKKENISITANLVKMIKTEKKVVVLIKADMPIFRGDKQIEKPYIKGAILDDNEVEIPEEEE